jgi:hypothetical protein
MSTFKTVPGEKGKGKTVNFGKKIHNSPKEEMARPLGRGRGRRVTLRDAQMSCVVTLRATQYSVTVHHTAAAAYPIRFFSLSPLRLELEVCSQGF